MKKLLTLTLTLLMLLSLTACNNDIDAEPPAPSDDTATQSRFADFDATRDFTLAASGRGKKNFIYGDYCYSANKSIHRVPLPKGDESETRVEREVVCVDPMCKHADFAPDDPDICPAYLYDPDGLFLLDGAESNGEQPIFYYTRCTYLSPFLPGFDWERDTPYELIRYDSSEDAAVVIARVNHPIKQIMTYNDRVYFATQTAKNCHELNTVKKTGGEVITLSHEEGYFDLLGADEKGIYANDEKGNVYSFGLALEDEALIYTVADVYPMNGYFPFDLGMYFEDAYLYFFADFEVMHYPYNPNEPDDPYDRDYDFIKHSIRRVPIDDPVGEGELVAESVFEDSVYGIYNNVLYYGPFDVTTGIYTAEKQMQAMNFSSSNGTIIGVRLDTLESFEVISDSGYNIFDDDITYINDRCIISLAFPYRNGMGLTYQSGYITLLDFETGALYNVSNGVRLYDGTIDK